MSNPLAEVRDSRKKPGTAGLCKSSDPVIEADEFANRDRCINPRSGDIAMAGFAGVGWYGAVFRTKIARSALCICNFMISNG